MKNHIFPHQLRRPFRNGMDFTALPALDSAGLRENCDGEKAPVSVTEVKGWKRRVKRLFRSFNARHRSNSMAGVLCFRRANALLRVLALEEMNGVAESANAVDWLRPFPCPFFARESGPQE